MLTYIVNNRSGNKDAYGNTFVVKLTGKSTRTIETCLVRSVRLTLQQGAQGTGAQEHILMHSKALTSTGNTRFYHLVEGVRNNSHIVATLKKRLTNNGLYDEFELDHSYQLTLQHPLHNLDFYFTDSFNNPLPIGQGEDVTTTVWQRDATFTGTYKEELDLTYDLSGLADFVPWTPSNFTFSGGSALSGTISGSPNSTWTRVDDVITMLWEDDPLLWYKMEVGPNKAQLIAISDYNDTYTAGTVLWTKASQQFGSAVSVEFSDTSDNFGSVDTGHTWEFSTITGYFLFTDDADGYTTLTEAYLGPSDKIRFKLVSSTDPQYSETAVGTVIYRENSSTITGYEPVSSSDVTAPANGWEGEDIGLHVELDARHLST